MRIVLALALAALIPAARAAAQEGGQGQAAARPQTAASPELAEAVRLSSEVVRLYAAGKYAEALAPARRALELREQALGASHELVAASLVNLAAVERSLEMLEAARGHYRRAVDILEKRGDESARQLITALEGQARAEESATRALELHKRALALKEKAHGPDSPEAAVSLFSVAHLSELLGDAGAAERHFKRFVDIAGKTPARPEDDVAVAYTRLACLAERRGKRDDAAALEARADEAFKRASDRRGPVQGGVINGKAISKPQPSYPAEAKRSSSQGTVEVQILVGENGAVLSACAQGGDAHPSLKRSSELAAYGARFTPTYVAGKPVKVRGVITYRFILQRNF